MFGRFMVGARDEVVNRIAPLNMVGTTREALVSVVAYGRIDGPAGGLLTTGYAVGCGVEIDEGAVGVESSLEVGFEGPRPKYGWEQEQANTLEQSQSRTQEQSQSRTQEQSRSRTQEQSQSRTQEQSQSRTQEQSSSGESAQAQTQQSGQARTQQSGQAQTQESGQAQTQESGQAQTQQSGQAQTQQSRQWQELEGVNPQVAVDPGPVLILTLSPGEVKDVLIGEPKEIIPDTTVQIITRDYHIAVNNCAGPVTIRQFTYVYARSPEVDDSGAVFGDPISL
ncbi:MspA family porin [Nocardia bhagyanarayanae]|uniref:MspA family porin n=1 Tax=Nocardia bhagyanarayanae TaxID=1215925 RepID=UPI00163A5F6A|nr:MspA family porin [Nocardia bhagyanarayanae]